MQAVLVTLCGVLVALLGGCLWYVLSRMGTRVDSLDSRLRGVEQLLARIDERFAHVEDQLTGLNEQVSTVLQKFQDMGERLSLVEDRTAP